MSRSNRKTASAASAVGIQGSTGPLPAGITADGSVTQKLAIVKSPKPAIIHLNTRDRLAINALAMDEQRLMDQLKPVQDARAKIIAEIEEENDLPSGTISAEYQYNGTDLIRASKD